MPWVKSPKDSKEIKMKKIRGILVAVLVLGMTLPAFAQQVATPQEETVVMKKTDLTTEQLAKVQSQQIKETLGAYAEYAEMGRGVGLAVGESLKAVKDVAVDLSNTNVGKFTMFLIAWKVMAKDVLDMGDTVFGYLVGIPFLVISLLLCALSYYRQCMPRRVLIEKGPGLLIWRSKKFEIFDPAKLGGDVTQGERVIFHGITAVILILIGSIMTFGC